METVYFATGNAGKVEELQPLFRDHGYSLEQVEVDVEEIQAVDSGKVARQKVVDSYSYLDVDGTVIVDDTGFFVESLGGFPGSLAYFFSATAGVESLIPLLDGCKERSAYFETAIAVYDGRKARVFTGKVEGEVPREKKGEPNHENLPYESYFVPDHGSGESYAENPALKEQRSHRRIAARKLLDWLEERP